MNGFIRFVTSKVFFAVAILALVSLGFLEFKQWEQRKQIQQEINALNSQAQALSKKNSDLQNTLSYLKTDEYTQKEARQQLNLAAPGEVVYSFQQPAPVQSAQTQANQDNEQVSNPHKWWNYFFKQNYN